MSTSPAAQDSGLPPIADLIRQLEASDKFERRDAAMYLAKWGPAAVEAVPALIKALDDREPQVWFHAVTAISRIGPGAHEATGRLIKDLGRYSERGVNPRWYRSAHALGMIGLPALDALNEALDSSNDDLQAGAAAALGWMGPEAAAATPALIRLLNDGDAFVREKSAEALSLIGASVLPMLSKPLRSEAANARHGAIRALHQMGDPAAEYVPQLHRLATSDPEPRVRAAAVEALPRIGMAESDYAMLLFELLPDESESVRHAVRDGLLSLPSRYTVQRLIHRVETEDDEQSAQAADLLGELGQDAADAVIPLINAVVSDRSPEARVAYRQALVQIGPVGLPLLLESIEIARTEEIDGEHWVVLCLQEMGLGALPGLMENLHHESPNRRICSILALRGMGREAADSESQLLSLCEDPVARVRAAAIPAAVAVAKEPGRLLDRIAPLLRDEDTEVRSAATLALGAVGGDAGALVPELTAMLEDPDLAVRTGAVQALGGIGRRAGEAREPILALLATNHSDLRLAGVRALGAIGSLDPGDITKLARVADTEDNALKEAVLTSLGQMGPDAHSALATFERSLADPNDRVRRAAIIGFGQVEPSAERLLPVLEKALTDTSPEIRHAAVERVALMRDEGSAATPQLIAMLANSEDQNVVLEALESLPADPKLLPLYMEALAHDSDIVRGFSCEALGKLGSEAKEALPALREVRRNGNNFVRRRARRAIEKIQGEG